MQTSVGPMKIDALHNVNEECVCARANAYMDKSIT